MSKKKSSDSSRKDNSGSNKEPFDAIMGKKSIREERARQSNDNVSTPVSDTHKPPLIKNEDTGNS